MCVFWEWWMVKLWHSCAHVVCITPLTGVATVSQNEFWNFTLNGTVWVRIFLHADSMAHERHDFMSSLHFLFILK